MRLEGWNFSPTPQPPGKDWRLNQSPGASELISHAYVMTPPGKPKRMGFRELPVW